MQDFFKVAMLSLYVMQTLNIAKFAIRNEQETNSSVISGGLNDV